MGKAESLSGGKGGEKGPVIGSPDPKKICWPRFSRHTDRDGQLWVLVIDVAFTIWKKSASSDLFR